MYKKQHGKCAICRKKKKKNLDVDHCHKSGQVRGLLCNSCNQALGYLNEDENIMRNAIEYLINAKKKRVSSKTNCMLGELHNIYGSREPKFDHSNTYTNSISSISGCTDSICTINTLIQKDESNSGIFFVSSGDVFY